MVKDYFARCEGRFPDKQAQLRQVSLALRREQVNTMEQLCRLCRSDPAALSAIGSIGAKRLGLIEQVCREYEADRLAPAQNGRTEGTQ